MGLLVACLLQVIYIIPINAIKLKDKSVSLRSEALINLLELSKPCTIVTYGLKADLIQMLGSNLHKENSAQLTFANVISTKKDFAKLIQGSSRCFIGIAPFKYNAEIQSTLFPTYKRQIILLLESNHTREETKGLTMSKHHHPFITLQDESKSVPHTILKSIHCKNRESKLVNIFGVNSNGWTKKAFLDRNSAERTCNNEKHAMHGQHLKASLYATRPFLFYPRHGGQTTGILIDLMTVMSDHLGFTFEGRWAGNWWLFYENGTVGGSLGEVVNGEADISLDQTKGKAGFFGQQLPYTYSSEYVFFELKPNQVPQYVNIVTPFDLATWVMFVTSLLCVSLALKVVSHQSKHRPLKFLRIVEITFGACFQEYFQSKKKGHNTKFSVLTMIWVVASFFLAMAFSGNLKSSLTRHTYQDSTKTIDEIVDKDMIIHTAKVFYDYLLSPSGQARPEVMRRLLCQVRKKEFLIQNGANIDDDTSNRVLQHGGVSTNNAHSLEYVRTTYLKNGTDFPFSIIPERLFGLDQGMLLQNYDPRGEHIGPLIERLFETGVVEHLMHLWMPYKDMAEGVKVREEVLQLQHFCLPLMFLSGGILTGCLILLIERCCYCLREFSNLLQAIKQTYRSYWH